MVNVILMEYCAVDDVGHVPAPASHPGGALFTRMRHGAPEPRDMDKDLLAWDKCFKEYIRGDYLPPNDNIDRLPVHLHA